MLCWLILWYVSVCFLWYVSAFLWHVRLILCYVSLCYAIFTSNTWSTKALPWLSPGSEVLYMCFTAPAVSCAGLRF